MIVGASSQDGGVSNLATGTWTGDGTAVTVTTGFRPRYVKLINLTDRTIYEVIREMAATHTLKTVAAGTVTDDTTSAVVLQGNSAQNRGFSVPAAVNLTGKTFHYIAFG